MERVVMQQYLNLDYQKQNTWFLHKRCNINLNSKVDIFKLPIYFDYEICGILNCIPTFQGVGINRNFEPSMLK